MKNSDKLLLTTITCYCIVWGRIISAILNHQSSIEVMDHASKINEHLSGLQEEVAKLYPLMQSENEQSAFLITGLILKGQNVLKALLVLMGEMPL